MVDQHDPIIPRTDGGLMPVTEDHPSFGWALSVEPPIGIEPMTYALREG
jgi:hypothetical protein